MNPRSEIIKITRGLKDEKSNEEKGNTCSLPYTNVYLSVMHISLSSGWMEINTLRDLTKWLSLVVVAVGCSIVATLAIVIIKTRTS